MALNGFVSVKRLIFLGCAGALLFLLVVSTYGKRMLARQADPVTPRITLERGSILDRNGKILAAETTLYNIAITRSVIQDKPLFAELIGPAVGIEKEELLSRLEGGATDFFYLKKRISEGEKEAIEETVKESRLRGIRLEPVMSRTYPENQLASHVVGFLGDEGSGLTGVEYSFQDLLTPPGSEAGANGIPYNVMLTIDGNIQYELEKIARKTMTDTGAEAVMMIAAEAKTGEILAYISEPSANLNGYARETDSARFDRPALYAYEPGSVFKIFSIASLIDMGVVRDRDSLLCDGAYEFTTARGDRVHIKCLDRHGWVTPRDVIRLSCNDGTAQMAERAQSEAFEQKLRDFGFGAKTGVELPGETTGLFYPSKSWSLRSKPTIAIGQEISVSALQMVGAATALANGGKRLRLTLLSKLFTPDGAIAYEHEPKGLSQVLSPESARLMLSYMETTSESGTGTRASVGDVPMAVKTGTAQMLNAAKNGYSDSDYISSCIGIFPANDPQVILYIAIVKPVGETYGGRVAAPVISTSANAIIDYLGIGRASATSVRHTGVIPVPSVKAAEIGEVMPDLTGCSKRLLTPLLARDDVNVLIKGDGYVVWQSPEPGTPIEKGMTIEFRLE